MKIIKKVLIVILALALLLFLAYKVWVANDEDNQIYIEETREELENFEKDLMENIETDKTDEKKNDEPITETDDTNEDNDEQIVETNNTNEIENDEPDEEIDSNIENQEQAEEETESKKELSEIQNIYDDALSNLEIKANQLLEDLISQAKAEYSNLSSEEKGSGAVLSKMASDYLNRSKELENQIDEIFYNLLSKMEDELIANDLDKSIIKQYEDDYGARKKARRRELMEKALAVQE
ncbi:MAG: hypothetical protein MJA31_04135 [Clostridia bacterium]|nr:hypothetical protein [Clostridia bacterium]